MANRLKKRKNKKTNELCQSMWFFCMKCKPKLIFSLGYAILHVFFLYTECMTKYSYLFQITTA